MSERVRAYVTGEPPDRVWTNDAGEVIAREVGDWRPLPGDQYVRPDARVGSEREGWKPRLGMVLHDLEAALAFCLKVGVSPAGLQRALAEVRSMIDGDEAPS